jgi:hypothetical protein
MRIGEDGKQGGESGGFDSVHSDQDCMGPVHNAVYIINNE